MPQLSFVIPYYQKIKALPKCLRSLKEQSVKDIEIILVLDGPDPVARRIAQKTKGIRIHEIAHGGAPAARNAGAELAKGEYIVFWDADCVIEPGAANVWMLAFKKYPDVDFVYSGYRFQEGRGAVPAEPFDPWLLRVNNYISGCFPIKRGKAPKWDTSLESLQDWDFWLTAVENGCKGLYLEGYAFKTEFPDKESISGKGCTPENWLKRMDAVRHKHGIEDKEVCVSALSCRRDGIWLAKAIGADYRDYPTYFPNRYKTIIQIGFDPAKADVHARNFHNRHDSEQPTRVLFWLARDVYSLRYEVAAAAAEALATTLNSSVKFQFCEDTATRQYLNKIGIKAVVLPLPLDISGFEIKPLPEKFRVLTDIDPIYGDFFDSVQRAMPNMEFVPFKETANIDDYSALAQFHKERCISSAMKQALLAGRGVISNVKAPFCGFIGGDISTPEEARTEAINILWGMKTRNTLNMEAHQYYASLCSPEKFAKALRVIKAMPDQAKIEVSA